MSASGKSRQVHASSADLCETFLGVEHGFQALCLWPEASHRCKLDSLEFDVIRQWCNSMQEPMRYRKCAQIMVLSASCLAQVACGNKGPLRWPDTPEKIDGATTEVVVPQKKVSEQEEATQQDSASAPTETSTQ